MVKSRLIIAVIGAALLALALAAGASARVALDPGFQGVGWRSDYVAQYSSGAKQVIRSSGGYVYTYAMANFFVNNQFGPNDTVVNRYLHDGTPDPAWDGNGIAYGSPDLFTLTGQAGGMLLNSDNSVITVGTDGNAGKVILERFDPNGNKVTSATKVVKLTNNALPSVAGIVRDSAGRLLVAGEVGYYGSQLQDLFVMRFKADGTPDASFGNGKLGPGTSTIRLFPRGNRAQASVSAVAIDGSDRVLVGGYDVTVVLPVSAYVYRFNTTGTSGALSEFTIDNPTPADYSNVTGIDVAADGRIALSATGEVGTNSVNAVVRMKPDLTLDSSFDGDGEKPISFGGSGASLSSVAWGPHSWIYAGGTSWNTAADGTNDDKLAIARVRYDGSLDATFDGDGKIVTDIPGTSSEQIQSLIVSPTNDLPVVSGQATIGGAERVLVARYADVP
jgi:uncharacterized delta-60 repeat protein